VHRGITADNRISKPAIGRGAPQLAWRMLTVYKHPMPSAPHADPRLSRLIDAALAGARVVMEVYGTDFSVDHKPDSSPVSTADVGSERAIAELLRAAMPDIPIVAEEEMAANGAPKIGHTFLLVDPLDGTKEFISRNGEFTVNIALIEEGAPVLGVVLAPALDLAYAGSASGAWKGTISAKSDSIVGWRQIRARASGPHPVAVASRSHMNPATADALSQAACGEHRSIGSSLKFALLAEGEADFYPRLGPTMEWDTAAGDAVLRAAGGVIVTLEGNSLRYGKTGVEKKRDFENSYFIAAGDPKLIERLDLAALRSHP
jgi:3'(2'), 5'-bisphosphate nucleotidase